MIGIAEEQVKRKVFYTSDGMRFTNFRKAYRHEMFLRLPRFFPESAFGWSSRYGGERYYFTRHDYIKCGVYRLTVASDDELAVLDHFFKGLRDELPELSEGDFPYTFDLDIYYEDFSDKMLIPRAQWRLYKEDNYRQ